MSARSFAQRDSCATRRNFLTFFESLIEIDRSRAGEWLNTLANFDIELYRDGQLMDRGHPSNVLGGTLSVVRHLVELLSRDPDNLPLGAAEIVASGTLTRALPVKAGETWTTKLNGIGLEGISLRFC